LRQAADASNRKLSAALRDTTFLLAKSDVGR